MRIAINSVLGVLIIAAALFFAQKTISGKKKPKQVADKVVKSVFVDTVKTTSIALDVPAQGSLKAARRVAIYSEVQGVFNQHSQLFKQGEFYKKGTLLVGVDGSEYYASLISQKTALFNDLTGMMPDLKMDFPLVFEKWEKYLKQFSIEKPLAPLPEILDDQENYFVNSHQIVSRYYAIKNMEQHYLKYQIRAPYSGYLVEAAVTPGTLIRSGQLLGEFIDPSVFELEVAVSKTYASFLKLGEAVTLKNIEGTKEWEGKVARINAKVDLSSQTIKVFISVKGKALKEGMYMEAVLDGEEVEGAIEISRKLLVNGNQVYSVKANKLVALTINPVYFTSNTVVITGVDNGTIILEQSVPGAHEGMTVEIHEELE